MQDAWVTAASFMAPPQEEPEFERLVRAEAERFGDLAREAGLDARTHVRVRRDGAEVAVEISPELDAVFTPAEPEWLAR